MTQELNPDQMPERSILKLKVNYNEQFLLPEVEINPEATIDMSVLVHGWHSNDKLPRFKIEVQGHPGYPVYVRKNHIQDMETRTTINGLILLNGAYDLVTDPFRIIHGAYRDLTYFSPFGPTNIENSIDVDKEGKMRLNVKKVPISIQIVLEDIWAATRGKDPTRVFLIYKNTVLEGLPLPFYTVGTISEIFSVTNGRWINANRDQPQLISGQISAQKFESRLLLPSDPEFFRTAKILIGDRRPEPNS